MRRRVPAWLLGIAAILIQNVSGETDIDPSSESSPIRDRSEARSRKLSHSRQIRRHLIHPSADQLRTAEQPNWVHVPPHPGLDLHSRVASGGDFTGDNLADVVVGDPGFEGGRGQLQVFMGSKEGLKSKPDMVLAGSHPQAALGRWVGMMGDVDGDGLDDLVASENEVTPGVDSTSHTDRLYRIKIDGVAIRRTASWPRLARYPAKDLNGDGFDDVATSADGESVRVYFGTSEGLNTEGVWTAHSEQASSGFGGIVSGIGDVNGDGCDDLLISAGQYSGRYRNGGKVYLYWGSRHGLGAQPGWTAEYDAPVTPGIDEAYAQQFGLGASSAGDVNHDGYDDFLVGARFADRGDRDEGLAFLYLGSSVGPGVRPNWTAEGNRAHAVFGGSLAAGYDMDGDAFDDAIIGLPELSNGTLTEGAVAVYPGSRKGLPALPAWSYESNRSHERMGSWVSSAGDLNGDGYADILMVGSGHEVLAPWQVPSVHGRIVVAYGGAGRLAGSSELRLDKPLLLNLQQFIETRYQRHGAVIYWGPLLIGLLASTGISIVLLIRVRRRLTAALEENRKFAHAHERTRLARDVHDHLGAQLSQIALWSDATMATGTAEKPMTQNLERVSAHARKALSDLSELVWTLNPSNDTVENFVNFLCEFAAGFYPPSSTELLLDIPDALPNRPLNMEIRQHLFAATKEALHNVQRHANATRVTLSVRVEDEHLRLEIADNGRGIDRMQLPNLRPKSGNAAKNGLKTMSSRLSEIGGVCLIQSLANGGTTVILKVPIPNEETRSQPMKR